VPGDIPGLPVQQQLGQGLGHLYVMHCVDQHVDTGLAGVGADVFVQRVFDAGHQLESVDQGVNRGGVRIDGVEGAGCQVQKYLTVAPAAPVFAGMPAKRPAQAADYLG